MGYLSWARPPAQVPTTPPRNAKTAPIEKSARSAAAHEPPSIEKPPAPVPIAAAKKDPGAGQSAPTEVKPAPPRKDPAIAVADKPTDDNDPGFNLRGPVPKVGFKVREICKLVGPNIDMILKSTGRSVAVRAAVESETEKLYTVKSVAGDMVTSYETKVIKGESTSRFRDRKGRAHNKERLDDLAGEVVVSERQGDGWNHTLLQNIPTPRQEQALARMTPWFEDREPMPIASQRLGGSWEVDATDIKKLFPGTDITAVSGKVQATLLRLEKHDGDVCAVIAFKGQVKGRWECDEDEEKIGTFSLNLVTHRSLKHAIHLETTGDITIRETGTLKYDGMNVEFTNRGRLTFNSTARIEK